MGNNLCLNLHRCKDCPYWSHKEMKKRRTHRYTSRKPGISGPWDLMETRHHRLNNRRLEPGVFILCFWIWRTQVYCTELKEEASLAHLCRRSLQGAVSGCNHPDRGSLGLSSANTVTIHRLTGREFTHLMCYSQAWLGKALLFHGSGALQVLLHGCVHVKQNTFPRFKTIYFSILTILTLEYIWLGLPC